MREYKINGAFHAKCVHEHNQKVKNAKQTKACELNKNANSFPIDDDEDDDKRNSPKIRQ